MRGHTTERKMKATADVVRRLAQETQRPVEEVAAVYEQQLAELQAGAKVHAYLDVIAARHTRERLMRH